MDSNEEKLCLDELDHLILDLEKKINVPYISNTWNVPFKVSESILQKWLESYNGARKIAKEFLIRGTDKENNAVIVVVPESKLAKIKELCPNCVSFLYSIETASLNGRSLNLPEPTENKFITLKADYKRRDIKVNGTVVNSVNNVTVEKKSEPTKKPTTNLFNTAKPKQEKQPETKTEKPSENEKKISPERKSPRKNQSNTKPNQAKSIATFFGSQPTTSNADKKASEKSIAEATVKIETIEIEGEPETKNNKSSKNPHKRNLSNESDSHEEKTKTKKESDRQMPSKKKMKLEPKSAKSRLMQICDSSSDEEVTQQKETKMSVDEDENEAPVKKEKENKTPSPQKNQNTDANGNSSSGKRRAKVKKMVTRTYEDEEGFINTVREMEEVSCSDEEPEPVVVEPPAKKTTSTASSSTNAKKKISPPVGKKQGSILSFFAKK